MKRSFFLTLLLLLPFACASVSADGYSGFYSPHQREGYNDGYRSTAIWWKNWTIRSSEELYERKNAKTNFPLTNLFDNDPKTTWADRNPRQTLRNTSPWRTRFGLNIGPATSARIDELWIMNGYNKSRDLFKRNDRIVEMQIWINDTQVKTVRLSDRMGWHKIKLPPNNFQNVGLLFTGIRKGVGPDNDVCISELALRYKGRKIEMQMPQSVFFEDGNSSGDAPLDCALIAARGGKVITQGVRPGYGLHDEKWNLKSNLVASAWRTLDKAKSEREKTLLWVADASRKKVLLRGFLPDQKNGDSYKELVWLNDKTLEVRWIDSDYSGEAITETIKFRKQYKIN